MIFGDLPLLAPQPPLAFPRGRPCGGWGWPKMKIDIIFEFPTIENPKIDITLVFCGYNPSAPKSPPPWGALVGFGGSLK